MEINENENKGNIKEYVLDKLRNLFNLSADQAPENETIESIKAGVDFKGAKLWILIFAVFVASLGLNTNSAAVIIGAMLISPLMGPIMGMGLGIGINDFDLLKRSFRNYAIATVFSVLTATTYFLITPLDDVQSELLARTFPTIYDVFIALCGGLAGIIALGSVGQRSGNVIPGVAIATALMPPLCTCGFGVATGNWSYAAGAFYLYLINTIFISLATFIGVNIMNFHKKVFVDKLREKRVKRIITAITVITILPSILLTYTLWKENVYTKQANNFVNNELNFEGSQVIEKNCNYKNKTLKVVMVGEEIDSALINNAQRKLSAYDLEGIKLTIVQGTKNINAQEIRQLMAGDGSNNQNTKLLAEQQLKINKLESELSPYRKIESLAKNLGDEVRPLFPEVGSITLGSAIRVKTNEENSTENIIILTLTHNEELSSENRERLVNWLESRIKEPNLELQFNLSNDTIMLNDTIKLAE